MSDDCCPACHREDCPAMLPSGGDSQLCALQNCHRATVARAERAEVERDEARDELARLRDARRWRSVEDEPPPCDVPFVALLGDATESAVVCEHVGDEWWWEDRRTGSAPRWWLPLPAKEPTP